MNPILLGVLITLAVLSSLAVAALAGWHLGLRHALRRALISESVFDHNGQRFQLHTVCSGKALPQPGLPEGAQP